MATAPAPGIPDVHLELEAFVREKMEELKVPGVAVAVVVGDQTHAAGFGVTSVENPLPVTPDTLFQIGSTTKTVTGTLVMRLVEAGRLDLDEPVRTYLPALVLADPEVADRVTMRHLLTHTGGWSGDFFEDSGLGDDALERMVARLAELPQLTPLGEVWSYNNVGFYIAGRVVEAVTGTSYEAAVREYVLEPLGMSNSFFPSLDLLTRRVAVGHTVRDEEAVTTRPWAMPRGVNPAGGLLSSAPDQLRYARFHLGDGTAEDGTQVLSPESMRLMQAPQAPAGTMADFVGLTWLLRDVGGTRLVSHGGTTHGQLSAFVMVPERGFAITVLTNADKGGQLHGAVTKWALEHYLGLKDTDPEPLALADEELAPYAGLYSRETGDVTLSISDNALVLEFTRMVVPDGWETPPTPPPVTFRPYAEDRMVAMDGPYKGMRAEFLRGPDGSVVWLRFGGRVSRRQAT